MTRDASASLFRRVGGLFARFGPTGATANAREAIAEHARIEFVVAALERRVWPSASPAQESESRTA